MQTRLETRAAALPLVLILLALIATCDDPPVRAPTSPSEPFVMSVMIDGPETLAPGASAQYRAVVRLMDGTEKVATPESGLAWSTSSTSLLRVDASGLVTAVGAGDAILTARVLGRSATRSILAIPDGTYRVTGTVRDAEFPAIGIGGARVEATPGPEAVQTQADGTYRLYGVPPGARLRVSAEGYLPAERDLVLTSHSVQNLALELAAPRLGFNGPYTLTIDMDGTCSTLAPELQHREYDVDVVRGDSRFKAHLTRPEFRVSGSAGNSFEGVVAGKGVSFTLFALETYYYFYYGSFFGYPSVAEQLADGPVLIVSGTGTVAGTEHDLSGLLNGRLETWDFSGSFPRFMAACSNSPMRVAFKRR